MSARKSCCHFIYLPLEHGKELVEIDGAVAVCIYFLDHVFKLAFGRRHVERFHNRAQFLGVDEAVAVLKPSLASVQGFLQRKITLSKRSKEALYSEICSVES